MHYDPRSWRLPWSRFMCAGAFTLLSAASLAQAQTNDIRQGTQSLLERSSGLDARTDSTGNVVRNTHNPLASEFDFYREANPTRHEAGRNEYSAGVASTDTQGADGGFPEWMHGSTFPWYIQSYTPTDHPGLNRPPSPSPAKPYCNYMSGSSSSSWVVEGTAVRYMGCEVRNMNTGDRDRHHYDHCELDAMAHNDMPTDRFRFRPTATNVLNWNSKSDSALCPTPRWIISSWTNHWNSWTSWSPSSASCGTGSYTQRATRTGTATRTVTCRAGRGASNRDTIGTVSDSICIRHSGAKPSTSKSISDSKSRSRSRPSCPPPPPPPPTPPSGGGSTGGGGTPNPGEGVGEPIVPPPPPPPPPQVCTPGAVETVVTGGRHCIGGTAVVGGKSRSCAPDGSAWGPYSSVKLTVPPNQDSGGCGGGGGGR